MLDTNHKVGDLVIYEGLIGRIESISPVFTYEYNLLSLVSVEDHELSCSAPEHECQPYTGQEIDQSMALWEASLSSARIRNIGESLTDKYFRDGNH